MRAVPLARDRSRHLSAGPMSESRAESPSQSNWHILTVQGILRNNLRKIPHGVSMADDKNRPLDFRVSPVLYKYLGYLAKHTILGPKEIDVARALLTERLNQMIKTKEHEKMKPPQDESDAPAKETKAPNK